MADGITNDASPQNQFTMPASPPKFVLEKSDRRIKLTTRKRSRIASTDNVKKPTTTDEQKTSELGVNSMIKAQEAEKLSDPMLGNLRPLKPPTTTNEITIEEKGEEKTLKQSKKKNHKPICPDFNISLSREEITNDLFVLTGERRRLSRNSQRRHKNVQKNLDTLYPGLLRHTITPERYNVPEDNPRSRKL